MPVSNFQNLLITFYSKIKWLPSQPSISPTQYVLKVKYFKGRINLFAKSRKKICEKLFPSKWYLPLGKSKLQDDLYKNL